MPRHPIQFNFYFFFKYIATIVIGPSYNQFGSIIIIVRVDHRVCVCVDAKNIAKHDDDVNKDRTKTHRDQVQSSDLKRSISVLFDNMLLLLLLMMNGKQT